MSLFNIAVSINNGCKTVGDAKSIYESMSLIRQTVNSEYFPYYKDVLLEGMTLMCKCLGITKEDSKQSSEMEINQFSKITEDALLDEEVRDYMINLAIRVIKDVRSHDMSSNF